MKTPSSSSVKHAGAAMQASELSIRVGSHQIVLHYKLTTPLVPGDTITLNVSEHDANRMLAELLTALGELHKGDTR